MTVTCPGRKGIPAVSLTARALATCTGDPLLKLVLLTVAAAPGWPTYLDVAAAAELPAQTTADALHTLVRRRLLSAHTGADETRYGLPDDGWTFGRDADDAEPDAKAAAPVPDTITGAAFTGRTAGQPS
jgi:hypothetical protein